MDLDSDVGENSFESNRRTARKLAQAGILWMRAVPLAAPCAGLVSGLFSWAGMRFAGEIALNHVPVAPALCLWVAFSVVLIDIARRPLAALAALPAIYAAWFLAVKAALLFAGDPYKTEPDLVAAGALGGFVGTAALLLVCAALRLGLRGIGGGSACLIAGTVTGLSLQLAGGSIRLPYDLGLAVLFLAWQASVLSCLAAMSRGARAAESLATIRTGTAARP